MKGLNSKKLMKSINLEHVVIAILVIVLIVLVVVYVNKNNEGFSRDTATLYFFHVDWCPHCTTAKKTTFDGGSNETKIKNTKTKDGNSVELVKVDCEGSDEEKALAKKHGVSAFPTVILVFGEKTEELKGGVSPSNVTDLISSF